MASITKQVVEISQEDFDTIVQGLGEIKTALQELGAIRQPEFLTAMEFMERAKISRWKFDELRDSFRLKTIRRGKKIYIPASEVTRYFDGKLDNDVQNQ